TASHANPGDCPDIRRCRHSPDVSMSTPNDRPCTEKADPHDNLCCNSPRIAIAKCANRQGCVQCCADTHQHMSPQPRWMVVAFAVKANDAGENGGNPDSQAKVELQKDTICHDLSIAHWSI